MIKVEYDPNNEWPRENCCFCRMPTSFWYTPRDVACCEECASIASDTPTKDEWLRKERMLRMSR